MTVLLGRENLIGKQIILRPLETADATEEYSGWLSDPDVNKYIENRNVTVSELKRYIQEKTNSQDALLLGIFGKENNNHIGNIKLEPINWQKKTGTVGILVGNKNYWGKGIATEAIGLLSDYATNVLELVKLELAVSRDNKAAIRAYEKCGFVVRKIELGGAKFHGQIHDKIWMEKICTL